MTHATIRLLDWELMRDKPMCNPAAEIAYAKVALANDHYKVVCETNTDEVGRNAAEEMFDLTNNPSRQDEREGKYGRGRSLSSGDIVTVDGADWLCLSIGWQRIDA